MKKTLFVTLISLLIIYTFMSSCKKEVIEKTTVQQDTIFVHDTITVIDNYSSIEEYNSGNNSELISSIPIVYPANWSNGIIYSLLIPNLKTGDIITAFAECEVTNDAGPPWYDVAIVSQLILGTSSSALPGSPNFYEISEANGSWVSHNDQHHVINQVGTWVCPGNAGNRYVNFCTLAYTPTIGNNPVITVEQDYGRLSVIVYRK